MTAAQALAPGLSSPSSGRAPSSGAGSARGGGSSSFGDTLDRAAKGSPDAAALRPRGESQDKTQSNSDPQMAGSGAEIGVGEQNAALAGALAAQPKDPQHGAAAKHLGGGADQPASLVARLQALLGQSKAEAEVSGEAALEDGPWLPGMVDDDGEVFDAVRLLAIMRSDGAHAANASGGATVVTVLGQERHLALARMSPELASAVAQEQDLAATVRGEAKSASNGAAISSQADVASDGLERMRGQAQGDDVGRFGTELGAGRRGALFAAEGRGQSGAGLGEHGQDGRQQDGRNSGSGGQATGANFASAMQGVGFQAANAARGTPGVASSHDPVGDQIAARIRSELTAGGAGEPSSEGVVKVLNLELKPANLGAVTVRMQLKDNVISIHVEAQNSETRALIEREQAKLTSALSAAGYTVETITAVQGDGVRSSGFSAPGDNSASGLHEPGNQNQGSQGSSDEGRSGRPSGGGDHQRSGAGAKDDSTAAAHKGVDGVYV